MTPRPTGHHGEKPSETLVRFIVEQTLGVRVCCYDDRGGRSRPDAIIHYQGGVPLEIVSDPLQSENQLLSALEKIGRRAEFDGLKQGYRVCLTRKARINDLTWLEQVLRQLEDPEQRDPVTGQTDNYLFVEPDKRLPAGEVRFTSGSGGGRPIRYGPDVISAASAVLAQKYYADVARKLDAYGGVERHAVLVVDDEKDATFSWLRRATPADVNELPAPELTAEITTCGSRRGTYPVSRWLGPRRPAGGPPHGSGVTRSMLWMPGTTPRALSTTPPEASLNENDEEAPSAMMAAWVERRGGLRNSRDAATAKSTEPSA